MDTDEKIGNDGEDHCALVPLERTVARVFWLLRRLGMGSEN